MSLPLASGRYQQKMKQYISTIRSKNPKLVVERIRKGSDFATQALVCLGDHVYFRELVNAGLVDAILRHLEHCSSKLFREYMRGMKKRGGGGGDLTIPSVWVNILAILCYKGNLGDPDTSLRVTTTVAGRIGPLVDAMGKTERREREFFGDEKYWAQAFFQFNCLIANLAQTEQARVILRDRYNGAVENIVVRALFLDLHGGPIKTDVILHDEGRGLGNPNSLGKIQNAAAIALQQFSDVPVRYGHNNGTTISPPDKRRLQFLADIPVAPGAECTLATGLFELIANADEETKQSSGYYSVHYVYIQLQVGLGGECFRSVESSKSATCCQLLIDISEKNLVDYPHLGPFDVHSIQCSLLPIDSPVPKDDIVSAAVKHGVLELTIQWLLKTQGSDEDLVSKANMIIETVGIASLLPKTNKALRQGKDGIVRQLGELKRRGCAPPQAGKIQALLNKAGLSQISSVAGGTSASQLLIHRCRSCNVALAEGSAMRCAKCECAVYCSRECQVRDWKHGGHKAECKQRAKKMRESTHAKAAGGSSSASAIRRAAKTEENLTSSGNVLFANNYKAILLQASLRGQSITDCVVVLYCMELVPTMETMRPEEFFARYWFSNPQHARSVFECNRSNGGITMACVGVTPNGPEVFLKTMLPENALQFMPSTASVAPEERWNMVQSVVAEQSKYNVVELWNNCEERDRVIKELMVSTSNSP